MISYAFPIIDHPLNGSNIFYIAFVDEPAHHPCYDVTYELRDLEHMYIKYDLYRVVEIRNKNLTMFNLLHSDRIIKCRPGVNVEWDNNKLMLNLTYALRYELKKI